MPALTLRVVTSMPGWDRGTEVTVERTPYVEALIDTGRVELLADPESAAHDQGDDPEPDGELEPGATL